MASGVSFVANSLERWPLNTSMPVLADLYNGGGDTVAVGGDNGPDKIDFASVLDISGAAISNQINSVLADLTNATPRHYTFIHIAEPDLTGHSQNWGTPNWSNAVRMVDTQLGRIINAIDANPVLLNQTALIVLTGGDNAEEGPEIGNSPLILRLA